MRLDISSVNGGVTGSDGCISDSLSDEAPAYADRADEQDVLVACQELE